MVAGAGLVELIGLVGGVRGLRSRPVSGESGLQGSEPSKINECLFPRATKAAA